MEGAFNRSFAGRITLVAAHVDYRQRSIAGHLRLQLFSRDEHNLRSLLRVRSQRAGFMKHARLSGVALKALRVIPGISSGRVVKVTLSAVERFSDQVALRL